MPKITWSMRSGLQAASLKTPANFLSLAKISFGHLITGACLIKGAMVSASATAAMSVICGA